MVSPRRTWSLEEFGGGLDLRDGLFSDNQTRFRELTNLWVTKGRKLRRRPPCLRTDGELSSLCQGLVSIDGQLYTFAKSGDTITHTGDVATEVQTLTFDVPDLTTDWELIAAGTFDGYAACWIRHTFPSTAYPSLCFLHVWDGLVYAPTFVQDPYLPGSFSPSIADLTDQVYDANFNPVFGLGASKLWTSTVRGNAHCCRTADARVWNQRTNTAILEVGEQWCFVVPEGDATVREYIVPRDASWLGVDARWAYYVLEYDNDGVWTPMEEVSGTPSADFTWSWAALASRFTGGWDEIGISVCWGRATAGLIRLRLVAGATSVDTVTEPTATIATGSGTSWDLSVTEATYRWRTNDLQTRAAFVLNIDPAGAAKEYLLGVAADGFDELVDITSTFPNGWEMEHRRFYKRLVFGVSVTGTTALNTPAWDLYPNQTGTVTVSAGSSSVVGVGTLFLTELDVGDTIRVNGEDKVILSITDNLNLAVTTNYAGSAAGASIAKLVKHYARFNAGETQVQTNLTTGAVGDNLRINGVDYLIHTNDGTGIYTVRSSAGAAGDYHAAIDAVYTVTLTATPVLSDYEYAFEANDSSDWYTNRAVEAVDNAGAEDALSLATASLDNSGGLITAIASVRQRMLIAYSGSMQLWSIDQDTNRTAYLDTLSFGTGGQATPPVVPWYSSLALPVATGIRAISVVGANTDNLQDLNIGEPIADLALDVTSAAQFWPWNGQLMFALNHPGSAELLCLDYSRESKITAWSRWKNPAWAAAGLDSIDAGTLVVEESNLWFRSGQRLYRFDFAATTYADFCDTSGNAYESAVTWHFNDMGKPGQGKRIVGMDLVQDGRSSIGFQLPPYGSYGFESTGPVVAGATFEGTTYGRRSLPLAMVAPGVAPRITSIDERGWSLQRLALHFMYLGR